MQRNVSEASLHSPSLSLLWQGSGVLFAWLVSSAIVWAAPAPVRSAKPASLQQSVRKNTGTLRSSRLRSHRKQRRLRWLARRPRKPRRGGDSTQRVTAGAGCRVNWNVRVLINFEQADLLTVVKWISKQTCQNFILNTQMRGQLHIISRTRVSLRAANQAFFQALKANGFTAHQRGGFWQIIFARTARQESIRTIINRPGQLPGREEMVTYLHRLKHLSANQIVGTIRYISSSSGGIIPYQPSNILIITDYAPNLRRVLKVLKSLDVPQAETRDRIYVLQIRHAEAQNIAQKLQQLFQIGQARGGVNRPRRRINPRLRRGRRVPVRVAAPAAKKSTDEDEDAYRITKLVADERTNQLILLCNARALKRASKLIKDLDIELSGDGQIRVHYLKYASADELSQTLSQLTQGTSNRRGARRGARRKASELFEGEVKITADKPTNSLVVVASRRDFESLLYVIDKLDVARKQVFIEIVVLEVSIRKTNELGLTFHHALNVTGDSQNPTLGILGTSLGGLSSLVLDPAALMGLAFGLRGAAVPNTSGLLGSSSSTTGTTGGIALGIPSFGVLIRALQTNTDVDIISTPHILATANEEATLQVGQNVPFIAGTTFTGAAIAGVPPIRNIQRQDVALTLKIKPQIDAGAYVRLDFDQELTELAEQNPELGPTTTKRKIKTVVLAKDRQTVVIGGLVRNKLTNGISKVPILGDIPLIGTLFRVKRNEKEKRNLLVFLTPYIIHSSLDFRRIFEQKMRERKQFLKLFYAGKSDQAVPDNFNYDRGFGLFEKIERSMKRGEREAAEMKKNKIKPVGDAMKKPKRGPKKQSDTPRVTGIRRKKGDALVQQTSQQTTYPR